MRKRLTVHLCKYNKKIEFMTANNNNIVWLQEISIPPPTDGFFTLSLPTPLEIPVQPHIFLKKFWPFRPPIHSEFSVRRV